METHCSAVWGDGHCERPLKTAGYCHAHYERMRKGGDPNSPVKQRGQGPQPRKPCSATGTHDGEAWTCEQPTKARGYCLSHWKQLHKGGQIRKLGTYVRRRSRMNEAGEFLCQSCNTHFPAEGFWMTNWGPRPFCKPCDAAARRASRYGISVEEAASRLADQDGRCAICGVEAASIDRAFAVDHDHSCCSGPKSCGKCLRGILCHSCNLALGGFRDNADLLRKALAYVERYSGPR